MKNGIKVGSGEVIINAVKDVLLKVAVGIEFFE